MYNLTERSLTALGTNRVLGIFSPVFRPQVGQLVIDALQNRSRDLKKKFSLRIMPRRSP